MLPKQCPGKHSISNASVCKSFQKKRQYDTYTASTYIRPNHGEDPAIAKVAAVVLI